MVVDDSECDVAAALGAGLEAILVQTGKYREGDEKRLPKGAGVAKDIGAAVEGICRRLGSACEIGCSDG